MAVIGCGCTEGGGAVVNISVRKRLGMYDMLIQVVSGPALGVRTIWWCKVILRRGWREDYLLIRLSKVYICSGPTNNYARWTTDTHESTNLL